MKLVIAIAAAVVALPLLADEPQKPQTTTTAATTTAAPAPAVATQDSPLVAAAKAKSKTGKSKIVLTNKDLLKGSEGHFTTVSTPAPIPKIERKGLTPEQEADNKKREELDKKIAEEKAAKAKKEHDRRMAMAAAQMEGDTPESLYDDPAEVEHRAEVMTQDDKPQQTSTQGQQKPPL